MISFLRRAARSVRISLLALLPSTGGSPEPGAAGEALRLEPWQLRGGMGRFLDGAGELRVFFPDTLPLAAPFILFRLKREGFSRCSVQALHRGLLVRGRR